MRYLLILLLLAAPVSADRRKLLADTIKQVETALLSGDWQLVRSALWRAKAIRDRYTSKEILPLATAIAVGVKHKNTDIAVNSAQTLGKLRVPGITKLLADMLDPPKVLSVARHGAHLACIEAVAELHEPTAVRHFEKLLKHPDREFAVAGARALGGYWGLSDRNLIALVQRLAVVLGRLDADLATAKEQVGEDRDMAKIKHLQAVRDAVVESLRKLTDFKKLNTPADCAAWVKRKRKGDA